MGRLDGTPVAQATRTFQPRPFVSFRSLEPFARRHAAEGVVFGYFDGVRSVVEWVDPRSGAAETIFQSDAPIHDAVLSRDRKTLYAALLNKTDHREAGVWAFDLPAKGGGRLLLAATGFDPANVGLLEELFTTPDGSALVVRDCFHECRVRVVDLATHQVRIAARRLPTNTTVWGLTDTEIVYDANCALPCPLSALDLSTGRETPVGWFCSAGVVVGAPEGTFIVADGQPERCANGLRVTVSPLGAPRPPTEVFRANASDVHLVSLGDDFDGYLPEGAVLIAGGSTPVGAQPPGLPLLLDVRSGRTTVIPELRSR
jgi:hypothetical protein